jgi:hypothetical protein
MRRRRRRRFNVGRVRVFNNCQPPPAWLSTHASASGSTPSTEVRLNLRVALALMPERFFLWLGESLWLRLGESVLVFCRYESIIVSPSNVECRYGSMSSVECS